MEFLKTYKKYIIYGVIAMILILSLSSFVKNRVQGIFQEHEISDTKQKVNLDADAGFIDCIAIQHSCLYDHINKNQFKTIKEDCKGENYCNNTFK